VGRRAGALAAAALDPKDQSRSVVLAAAVAAAGAPGNEVPSDAIVFAPERVLVDAIARSRDWMGGSAARVDAERAQEWWRLDISGSRRQLEVAEVGEPLLRHLVEVQAGGWLDASDTRRLAIYLPAA
jgi:hypothetical protein